MKTQNPNYGQSAGGQNVAGYVGEITWFADSILRKNHLWANGAPVDAAQWPELAEYAAAAGWAQNEAGQYLTPDLRGRFLLGASESHAAGSTGGEETHTLVEAELPKVIKPLVYYKGSTDSVICLDGGSITPGYKLTYQSNVKYGDGDSGIRFGDDQPHNNMPPYYTANAQIRARVDTIQAHLTACPYEVGDILQTKSETLPSERWPGTEWAAIESFLLGAGTSHAAGSTGGSETHTLTAEEIPEIPVTGDIIGTNGAMSGQGDYVIGYKSLPSIWNPNLKIAGGGQAHNNMPPYTAVYIWERTA